MGVRSLNGLDSNTTNVYINTNLSATEPVVVNQTSFNNPITVSLKGLSGIGSAGQVIKVNSLGNGLEYGDDDAGDWTVDGSNIYPNTATKVLINTTSNPNGYGLLVLDKEIAIQTSSGSGASQGLRIINDTYSVLNYVDNNGDMFWTGAQNNFNFAKQVIINTTGAELSNGTNTYTLPSSNGTLALTSDLGGEWTLNSGNLYPNATATNVIIGNTLNLSNRKLYISGDAELTGNLYFNNGDIYIDSNSQNLRNYAGYTAGNIGGQHLFYVKQSNGTHKEIANIRTGGINSVGDSNVNSGKNVISLLTGGNQYFKIENTGTSGGTPYVDFQGEKESGTGTSDYYFKWSIGTSGSLTEYMRLTTNGLEGSNLYWKAQPIAEIYGGTNQSSYTTGDILYASATNTLAKLSIGSSGQVLKVSSGGIVEWATDNNTDLTTATGFGTAATSDVSVGNSAGTAASVGLKLYGDEFLLHNTSNVNVATFTPVSNTCNLSLNGGVLSLATMGSNTTWNGNTIAYNYGGTGLSSLTADKILQVNSTADGYNLIDLPSTTTQYWSLSSNVLSPINSSYAIRSENGVRYGTAGEFVDIGYNTTTNVFSIDHSGGNNIFDYDDDNGYINWGTTAGARMDFKSYIIHGSGTAYPTGAGLPFGTLETMYVSGAYIKAITTDDITVSEYNGNPASTSSSIRCNSSQEIYFTGNKLKIGQIIGDTNASNIITDDATSFQIQSANNSFILALRPSGASIYPYLGSPSTTDVFHIHINTISGDPYEIKNTDNTVSGFQHYLNGEEVSMCSDQASYYHSGSYTYFYNPSGTNGDHTFAGAYYAYHDNGSAIYFNLSGGGTSSGYYYSFATANTQKARIDMSGQAYITGSWNGSWNGSDRRLKENIMPIENAKDTLMKINVYQFDKYDIINYDTIHHEEGVDTLKPFKERLSENAKFVYGFIAQELCENTPTLGKMCVETNDWGEEEPAYIVNDRPMLACAIKTIQEQQEEINTLKEEVNTYKSIIDKLIKAPSFKSFKESLA